MSFYSRIEGVRDVGIAIGILGESRESQNEFPNFQKGIFELDKR